MPLELLAQEKIFLHLPSPAAALRKIYSVRCPSAYKYQQNGYYPASV
jgi:hypothetical protein